MNKLLLIAVGLATFVVLDLPACAGIQKAADSAPDFKGLDVPRAIVAPDFTPALLLWDADTAPLESLPAPELIRVGLCPRPAPRVSARTLRPPNHEWG